MRIVIVNPNTTQAVTDLLVREARAVAGPRVEILGFTAEAGVAAIDSLADAEAAADGIVDRVLGVRDADAGVIGGFVDPGLAAARIRLPYPVIGLGEASMLTACLYARHFGVITVGRSTASTIDAIIDAYGLRPRVSAVQAIDGKLSDVSQQQSTYDDRFVTAANDLVDATGAGRSCLAAQCSWAWRLASHPAFRSR
jgi:Asp/Glu/hydantoin racemase